jgi:hypothetical protein
MGPSGFTSHLRGRCAAVFIALENPSLWPGSNPQPLGPVASTPTTTPPRRLLPHYSRNIQKDSHRLVHIDHVKCGRPWQTSSLHLRIAIGPADNKKKVRLQTVCEMQQRALPVLVTTHNANA